jgi:hypothetical protein
MPLPGAGETRYHETRMVLRWALYGDAPISERTIDSCCKRYKMSRQTLQQAWEQDGIEAEQARLEGIRPINQGSIIARQCKAMGSVATGEAEAREREGQLDLLRARRLAITQSLEAFPSRLQQLTSSLAACGHDSIAQISLAIDSANREASKLVTDLRNINSMVAEAAGLNVIQALSLAAAKAQALKPQAPAAQERETRGVVVEL